MRFGFLAGVLGWILTAGCHSAYVPDDPGGDSVHVPSLPPQPGREKARRCDPGAVYLAGEWDWDGDEWTWRRGRCVDARPGMVYVPAYYKSGVYYRGYWAPVGEILHAQARWP